VLAMRKLKLFLEHRNYMCIHKTHIFINFNNSNLDYLNTLHPNSVQKIHVFITNHAAINESLRFLIKRFGRYRNPRKGYETTNKRMTKIILHFPKQLRGLLSLSKEFLGTDGDWIGMVNKTGYVYFNLDTPNSRKRYNLQILYNENNLSIDIEGYRSHLPFGLEGAKAYLPVEINFIDYPYELIEKENDTIFQTAEMRLDPEKFKDILIEKFKSKCPPKILKTLGSDNDIWNYIMQQGEWSIKEDDKNVKRAV
jgi:hypothetical protein